ncbi:hypothetical protein MHYMCMPSP_00860 [Hyalomma marginatum]|uniref:Uncharacterized protein n=1 Tax=Hyalomma marginatum TaxID=34627 RepID=A0A8S4BX41_9ACAR|nr:hypothetical protein MHYMCMPASI_00677 [Hyalomma marginatum]CAG7594245.1 hypothetical protein MHYMCMPSP_00860 [Hyalomma marginatum]
MSSNSINPLSYGKIDSNPSYLLQTEVNYDDLGIITSVENILDYINC